MIKESKIINLVFRIAVFCTFALCIVSCSMLFLYAVNEAEKSRSGQSSDAFFFLDKLTAVFSMFDWIMYLFIGCAVLSILTRYKATLISVCVRTVLLLSVSCMLLYAKPVTAACIRAFEILADADADLSHMSDDRAKQIFEQKGLSEEDAKKLIDDLNDDGRIKTLFMGVISASVLSFILSLTSLHNLTKRNGALSGMHQELPADAESLYDQEQYQNGNNYYDPNEDDF